MAAAAAPVSFACGGVSLLFLTVTCEFVGLTDMAPDAPIIIPAIDPDGSQSGSHLSPPPRPPRKINKCIHPPADAGGGERGGNGPAILQDRSRRIGTQEEARWKPGGWEVMMKGCRVSRLG